MNTPVAKPSPDIDRCKTAATSALRWIEEEITNAPEEHIRALDSDIILSMSRSALQKMAATGEKIPASVLCSIDSTRLNKLHLAFVHDPASPDGRKNASEYTVQASKFLNLENMLIDKDLVQYTVIPDVARIGVQSRHDRANSARYMMTVIEEMSGA